MLIIYMFFLSPKIRISTVSSFESGIFKILWSMRLLTNIATPPPCWSLSLLKMAGGLYPFSMSWLCFLVIQVSCRQTISGLFSKLSKKWYNSGSLLLPSLLRLRAFY